MNILDVYLFLLHFNINASYITASYNTLKASNNKLKAITKDKKNHNYIVLFKNSMLCSTSTSLKKNMLVNMCSFNKYSRQSSKAARDNAVK